jgi:hypothetical protein
MFRLLSGNPLDMPLLNWVSILLSNYRPTLPQAKPFRQHSGWRI